MGMLPTQVSPESIAEYFTSLATVLDGIPTSFVQNTDEVGHADWPDAHADTIYAPLIAVPTYRPLQSVEPGSASF
jgi:hypothetical protein